VETNLERGRSTVDVSVVLGFFSCSRSNVFGIGKESCCGLNERRKKVRRWKGLVSFVRLSSIDLGPPSFLKPLLALELEESRLPTSNSLLQARIRAQKRSNEGRKEGEMKEA